jgi:hypothetical protein
MWAHHWRTGKEARPPLRHDDNVLKVSLSPDGRFLAALKAQDWSKKPKLLIWDVASATTVVWVPHTNKGIQHELEARFRPDARAVAFASRCAVCRLSQGHSARELQISQTYGLRLKGRLRYHRNFVREYKRAQTAHHQFASRTPDNQSQGGLPIRLGSAFLPG